MATADEYAAWIVKNADKKGTPDFEVVAKAYRAAKMVEPPKPIDPTEGVSATQKVLAGIGSGMTDLAYGVGQRVGLVDQETIDEKKALDAPLKATTSGSVGNVVGKVALGIPAAFIPGANTLAGAAAIGGVQGLAEPTATGESVLKNAAIGAGAGAGGVVLGRALRAGYQGLKGLIEPFTDAGQSRIAGRVLERFSEDPNAMRQASSAATATGARPTLAEATKDRGIATLERSLAQQDPKIAAALAQRAADNNAARVGVVSGVAGDQGKRAAAVAAREDAAGQMYKTATSASYTVDDELSGLLQRPAVRQAMQRAQTLAENQGRKFAFDVNPSNAFSGVGIQTNATKQISGQGLQDLKMAMDEMLSDPASGFAGKAGDAVKNLRGQLLGWMEKANPDFKTARQSYANLSKPINEMDVGQRLLDKTTAAIRDLGGNQKLQANAFSRALNDEQALVRGATGFKGVNALGDVVTPENVGKLNAVRNELELAANLANAANGPGSQTAKSLASQNLMRQILGPTGLPQSWAESTMLESLLRPVQFGMKAAEPRIQNKLAEIMLNPSAAKEALTAAEKKQLGNALQRLLPYLQQAGQQSAPAALVSGER
jgi:hypothetical protein